MCFPEMLLPEFPWDRSSRRLKAYCIVCLVMKKIDDSTPMFEELTLPSIRGNPKTTQVHCLSSSFQSFDHLKLLVFIEGSRLCPTEERDEDVRWQAGTQSSSLQHRLAEEVSASPSGPWTAFGEKHMGQWIWVCLPLSEVGTFKLTKTYLEESCVWHLRLSATLSMCDRWWRAGLGFSGSVSSLKGCWWIVCGVSANYMYLAHPSVKGLSRTQRETISHVCVQCFMLIGLNVSILQRKEKKVPRVEKLVDLTVHRIL